MDYSDEIQHMAVVITFRSIMLVTLLGMCLSSFAQQRNASYYFEKGEEALKGKNYKTALAHFNECLRLSPYFMEAYYSRAMARESLGDKQGALTDYNIYLESKPEDKEALFSRAVTRYDYGQWAVAKEDFLKLLSMPEGGETNTVYFQTDKSADGVTKAFTAHHNLKPTILNYLGLIETKLKNFSKALEYFDAAVAINPNDPDYFLNRGIARLQAQDSARALADFEQTLMLNPESSLARHNLAVLKKSTTTPEETEQLLTEAIEKNPKIPYSYSERGLVRMKAGNLKGALEDYNEAIRLDPTDPDYWLNRGVIKEQSKDLTGALADYRQVITLNADYEKGWLNHGNVLMKQNRFAEAIEDYTVAIMYFPEYSLAYYNRGLAYYRLGKKMEACNDLTQAKKFGAKVDTKVASAICK
jgi:tetratricopeptide (TPR) repeat protein